MSATGLGHANLRAPAATIEQLRRFYIDIVGLHAGVRPQFSSGSSGHWLYAGNRAVLHLTVTADCAVTAQPPGVFNHIAFDCDDLDAAKARLDAAGITYRIDVVDELQQVQLFLADPTGVGVELTFTNGGAIT
ncbi:MAG: diguanylate cyclase [Rhodanobacteraceae bacterium]|nr:MAG: diguanylate cyclase [Rhodanobacteraceae bacterium]